jgi:hypothetical protein
LREELVTALLLGFLLFAVELNTRKRAGRPEMNLILPASILSLLLIATRGEMFIVTIATAALLFVSSADRGISFRVTAPAAIVIASTAGLVLNAFVAYSAHVDPWGASKATASWLYWYEFSRDHSTTYIQQGIWISPYEYLFGHHTVEQVLLFGITGVRFLLPRMNALFAPYPIWHSAGFVDLLIFIDRYLYQTFPLLLTFPGMAYMAVAGLIYAMSRQNTRLVVLPLLVPAAAYCVVYGVLPWASDLVRYVCPFLPIVFIATIALPVEVIRVRCKGPLAPRDSFYRLRPFSSYVAAIILVTIVLLI